ncbi:MAG: hypothetical protein IPL39_10455 [Opitutaceae bacterium]|nr:hypothetical protein [Opitutaceae bacterium]
MPIFHGAQSVVLSITDPAEPAGFDCAHARAAAQVAPAAAILEFSARTGEGLDAWLKHLEAISTAKTKLGQ